MKKQTLKDLQVLAKEKGIKEYYKMRKAELIEELGVDIEPPTNGRCICCS